jgi:hypothetical protein
MGDVAAFLNLLVPFFVPSSLRGSFRARFLPGKCTPFIGADSKHALVRDQ